MSLSTVAGLHFITAFHLSPPTCLIFSPHPLLQILIYLFPSALSLLLLRSAVFWAAALICPPIYVLWTQHCGGKADCLGLWHHLLWSFFSFLAPICKGFTSIPHIWQEGTAVGEGQQKQILLQLCSCGLKWKVKIELSFLGCSVRVLCKALLDCRSTSWNNRAAQWIITFFFNSFSFFLCTFDWRKTLNISELWG